MADVNSEPMEAQGEASEAKKAEDKAGKSKLKAPAGAPFTLKKWNAVAMWQWDVECDTCAICRVQVMGRSVWRFGSQACILGVGVECLTLIGIESLVLLQSF